MADVMEHVAYLSQEVGPRPAGTEEEQQAALYITEQLQKDAGLSTVIEDFTGVSNTEVPRALCSVITLVFGILALALPVVALPAAIVTLISAAIFIAEAFDKPILSRLFSRGVSQNVVARYEPGYSPESGNSRRRKVVLIAHYDSGKARPEVNSATVGIVAILKWVVLGAFVVVPLMLLLSATVFLHASGAVSVVLMVITIIAMVLAALPLVQFILHQVSSYNDGANCNASGVAVLLEAAARVGKGRTDMSSVDEFSDDAVIHGEEAAREAGVIPEGTEVTYEAPATREVSDDATPAERLAAAKAAVAALSGKPVSDFMSEEVLEASKPHPERAQDIHEGMETFTAEEVQAAAQAAEAQDASAVSGAAGNGAADATSAQPIDAARAAAVAGGAVAGGAVAAVAAGAESAGAPGEEQASNLPAWFVEAQRKAKRTEDSKPVQRSRYADALDAAVRQSSEYFEEANNAVLTNAQNRMQAMSDGIVEVPAPASAWMQAHPANAAAGAPASADAAMQPGVAPGSAAPQASSAPGNAPAAAASQSSQPGQPAQAAAGQPAAASQGGQAAVAATVAVEAAGSVGGAAAAGAVSPAAAAPASAQAAAPSDFVPAPAPAPASASPDPSVGAEPAAASAVRETILPDDLSVPDVSQNSDIELPSFLTAQPTQTTPPADRTSNRIDVTTAEISVSGTIDGLPDALAADQAAADPGQTIAAAPVFVDTVTAGTDRAAFETVSAANASSSEADVSKRHMTLPSIGAEDLSDLAAPGSKQRAPLANGISTPTASGKNRLSALPSIDPAHPDAQVAGAHHNPTAAELRSSLPSFSGILPRVESDDAAAPAQPSTVSLTGSFAPIGATSAMAPVGDELLEDVDPDDIYVDDADDSAYDDQYTETGAFAGPSYVEMPKSRVRRFFDRFHHNKKQEEETTPQEWLDVDDDFEARSVGAARGGWESFRDEQDDYDDEYAGQPGSEIDDAFAPEEDDFLDDGSYGQQPNQARRGDGWYGGAFSRVKMGRVDMRSGKENEAPADADVVLEQPEAPEMQKIYQFRNPDFDTEVWFVALGADLAGHSGMQAFLNEHAQELRGSIVIELEALGAGELCMVDQEGCYKTVKTSSRMRRYTRKASQATGVSVGSTSLPWKSSASSFAITHGVQAMHLVGMDGNVPAAFGAREDSVHGVDADTLSQRVKFVVELLKSI